MEHVAAYVKREAHDKFGTLEHQLAAIAYNAAMEYYYLKNGGPTVSDALYKPLGTYDFSGDGKPKPVADKQAELQAQQAQQPPALQVEMRHGGRIGVSNTAGISPKGEESLFAKLADIVTGKQQPK
jgi:hypothetical protein